MAKLTHRLHILKFTENIDTSIGRVEDIENFIKVSVLGVIPFDVRREAQGEEKAHGKKRWQDGLLNGLSRLLKIAGFVKEKKQPERKLKML